MPTVKKSFATKTLIIDAKAVASVRCDCDGCPDKAPCCSEFEVLLTDWERDRIEQILDELAVLCPHLKLADGYDNVFDDDEDSGLWILEKDNAERCVFQYTETDGAKRCAIHTAAIRRNESPVDRKPLVCSIWPLAINEGRNTVELSVDEDAGEFDCVMRGDFGSASADVVELIGALKKLFVETRQKK